MVARWELPSLAKLLVASLRDRPPPDRLPVSLALSSDHLAVIGCERPVGRRDRISSSGSGSRWAGREGRSGRRIGLASTRRASVIPAPPAASVCMHPPLNETANEVFVQPGGPARAVMASPGSESRYFRRDCNDDLSRPIRIRLSVRWTRSGRDKKSMSSSQGRATPGIPCRPFAAPRLPDHAGPHTMNVGVAACFRSP